MKIAVIYGGNSNEREISHMTKDAVIKALAELNYDFIALELDENTPMKLKENNIDLVFNAGHGSFLEDGRLAALLDIMKIPYTHSNSRASAIGFNKMLAKRVAAQLSLNQPAYILVNNLDDFKQVDKSILEQPFVIKPYSSGSSVGVHIIKQPKDFILKQEYFAYGPIIIEEYIKGQEVHVAILANKAIGMVEISAATEFYDYEAKYSSSNTKYNVSPNITTIASEKILAQAELLHNFLGCNYISRVDFLVKGTETFLLEINTHPGFTEKSLVPLIAKEKNINFIDIVEQLIAHANYEN